MFNSILKNEALVDYGFFHVKKPGTVLSIKVFGKIFFPFHGNPSMI